MNEMQLRKVQIERALLFLGMLRTSKTAKSLTTLPRSRVLRNNDDVMAI